MSHSVSTARRPRELSVQQQLRQQILTGQLPAGAHLSEPQLAKKLGVSRTPIREALNALAAAGLVKLVPHRGAFVTQAAASTPATLQLYAGMLGLAARLATPVLVQAPARLTLLSDQVDALQTVTPSGLGAAQTACHETLIDSTDNPAFLSLWQLLLRQLPPQPLPGATSISARDEVARGYLVLLTAIKRDKPDMAEKTLREIVGKQLLSDG